MGKTTRTLNPLHFEDLEPHRFEDLVRQLTYQFRNWRMIEATGRLGADEGIDIRAIESAAEIEPDPSGEESEHDIQPGTDRVWIIQCKREKKLGPTDVRRVVDAAIPGGADPPHGFVLAAACDFSMKARNSFREHARSRGVTEVHVWGKAELEDMLFLPANDHLLFAYFNISLQVRRRSLKTELRSRLATKRALVRLLGEIQSDSQEAVLIRDPREKRYPKKSDIPDFADFPRWQYATFVGHRPPDHLMFIVRKHFAYADDELEHWDAMFGFADIPNESDVDPIRQATDRDPEWDATRSQFETFWLNHVPEKNRATLSVMRAIHYDRILAIDEHGDTEHGAVHLLVEFNRDNGPFEPETYQMIECFRGLFRQYCKAGKTDRITIFPTEIPAEALDDPPTGISE